MKCWRYLAVIGMLVLSACTASQLESPGFKSMPMENIKGFMVPCLPNPATTAAWEEFKAKYAPQVRYMRCNCIADLTANSPVAYPIELLEKLDTDLNHCALAFEDIMAPTLDAYFASAFALEDMQKLGIQRKLSKEYNLLTRINEFTSPLCVAPTDLDDFLCFYGEYIQRCIGSWGIQLTNNSTEPSPSTLKLNKTALDCAALATSSGSGDQVLAQANQARVLVDAVIGEQLYDEFPLVCLCIALDKIIFRLDPTSAPPASSPSAPYASSSPVPSPSPTVTADISMPKAPPVGKEVVTPAGLRIIVTKAGSGPACKSGDTISLHYTGRLLDGSVFDSSYERNHPLLFSLGQGYVIHGLDASIPGMRVGEERHVVIPPALGYGSVRNGPIPADSTLVFDLELMDIK